MGNNNKEVIMRLHALSSDAPASNNPQNNNANLAPLAWGNGEDVFALRLRQSRPNHRSDYWHSSMSLTPAHYREQHLG